MKKLTRQTKVIATIGPATESEEMLEKIILQGVDVCRLNMAHADHEWVREVSHKIRSIGVRLNREPAIMMDVKGPEIRTGYLQDDVELKKDKEFNFNIPSTHNKFIYLIDGEIEIGPRWRKQLLGGHLKSYRLNQSAIGICLVGNFEETRPSKKQIQALTQLVDWLQREVLRKRTRFAGHKELPGEKTVCPGKYFPLKTLHRRYG